MTLQTDCSIGIKVESTYGTAVTVDRFPEFVEQTLQQSNEFVTGEGLRVGKILPRSARRALGKVVAGGNIELELCTKGLGPFLQAMLGSNTSANRSGSIYQQLAVPAVTDPMPAYTIQAGVPPIGGGTTIAQTFVGAVCDEWEISAKAGEIAMLSTSWVAKEMLTATAYAAPSYIASPRLLTFQHASLVLGVNGTHTLTVPTGTALGSTTATPANANVTEFSVMGKNNADEGGYVVGSAGKRGRRPVYGMRELSGSFVAEFTDATLRDYYLAQSSLHAIITLTSDQDDISGGTYAALQIVIPALTFEGDTPTSNGGDIITQSIDWTGLDGEVAASPIYIAYVTSDTAL